MCGTVCLCVCELCDGVSRWAVCVNVCECTHESVSEKMGDMCVCVCVYRESEMGGVCVYRESEMSGVCVCVL